RRAGGGLVLVFERLRNDVEAGPGRERHVQRRRNVHRRRQGRHRERNDVDALGLLRVAHTRRQAQRIGGVVGPLREQGEVVVVDERTLVIERSRNYTVRHQRRRCRERHQQEIIDALLEIESADYAAQPLGLDQGLQLLTELIAR